MQTPKRHTAAAFQSIFPNLKSIFVDKFSFLLRRRGDLGAEGGGK